MHPTTNTPHTPGPPHPFQQGSNKLCICGHFGHSKENCCNLAIFANCYEFFQNNKPFCLDLGHKFLLSIEKCTKLPTIHHLRELHQEVYGNMTDDDIFHLLDANNSLDFH